MNAALEVRSELKEPPDHLAEKVHRSEIDLANEAVALNVVQQRKIIDHIQEGLAQVQRGEFVPDNEMEAFFASYGEPAA